MSWIWLLVVFALGLFVGYMLCDLFTTENKYTIGRMKNKRSPGATINSSMELKTPRQIRKELRQTRRDERRKKRDNGT